MRKLGWPRVTGTGASNPPPPLPRKVFTCESGASQHLQEFLEADLQILDDAAKRLTFQVAGMHWNHYASLIALAHIHRVASSLAPECETQTLGNAN